jgi:hypothetical protein
MHVLALPQKQKGRPEECVVHVTDVEILELGVNATASHIALHAVWLEPRVLVN